MGLADAHARRQHDHPLVNAYGGYYTGDALTEPERARAKERHVMLELFENRHVIEVARGRATFLSATGSITGAFPWI